ncbi:hypothetical protein HYW17_02440 [Candidatus Uhrbacteria bacterium]|nr:hypothetical protein [Candidatus Uhrbacteria bacterium]
MDSNNIPTIDVQQYGGKQVAVLDGKIIATGDTLQEVMRNAKQRVPTRPLAEIKILSVPRTLSVIYYASDISVRDYSA